MWIFVAFLSACYFFIGIAPIVYACWYSMWGLFWLSIAAWVANLVLISCVRKLEW